MVQIQACGSAEAYAEKHHIFVVDIITELLSLILKHCGSLLERSHAVVGGHIQNDTNREIKFQNKYEWSGRNQTPYPHNIGKTCVGTFVHTSGCCDHADIAAVVYAGSTNPCDDINCAYLVAWSVREGQLLLQSPNKVHVEAGPIENYIEIDWCKIKAKLDASCNTSYCVDETTGCEAFAKVSEGHHAAVVVSFGNIC